MGKSRAAHTPWLGALGAISHGKLVKELDVLQEKRCFIISVFVPLQGYYIRKESRPPLCGLRAE